MGVWIGGSSSVRNKKQVDRRDDTCECVDNEGNGSGRVEGGA